MPLTQIVSAPGIQRDGTLFDGKAYADGTWCRWYRGRPKKMGGYRELTQNFPEIGRGMQIDTVNSFSYTHVGSASYIRRTTLNTVTGSPTGVIDRTPSGFVVDPANLWQFDSAYDVGTTANYIFAHAAPNLVNIANDTAQPVYYGDITTTGALTDVSMSDVSGGVCALHPYLFVYGSDGYVAWSVPGEPTDFAGSGSGAVRLTASKVVKGLPLRAGPGSAPAGLFWSLDALSRVMFVGGTSVFAQDTISTSTSVLSSASIIEHNGTYYWPSAGGFLMFNGVLQEVPNSYNQAWFYKNVNLQYAQKMFAIKMPLWGEIWFCFPKGMATECNWAVIYNFRDKIWYDTPLPDDGRSCGMFEQVFPYPLMMGAAPNDVDEFSLWQHEFGVDKISGGSANAIRSSFKTSQISLVTPSAQGSSADKELSVSVVEPDFTQVGDMVLRVYGAPNAAMKEPPQLGADIAVPVPGTGAETEVPGMTITQRMLQFEFESNVAGGDYEAGMIMAHVDEGGDRYTS